MQTLSFLTGNKGKFLEIKHFLQDSGIQLKQITHDLEEVQNVDAKKVIEAKAREALRAGYKNFFLEDTSLYIDGMGRLPGPFIKWFLMELGLKGIAKMAKRMGGGKAYAETMIAFVKNHPPTSSKRREEIHYFVGRVEGRIVSPRGTGDFGWGSIFQPNGTRKTFGQMSTSEKHQWSMRIKAFETFKKFLRKN